MPYSVCPFEFMLPANKPNFVKLPASYKALIRPALGRKSAGKAADQQGLQVRTLCVYVGLGNMTK